jgi:hypothetical protein
MKTGQQGLCLDPFGAAAVEADGCCPPGRGTDPVAGAFFLKKFFSKGEAY